METNKTIIDRRREPRHKIYIDVKVLVSGNSFKAMAANISGGGMEIQSSRSINPNSNLTICMQLHEKFVFRGRVVWAIGKYIRNRWIYRVGVQTESIKSNDGKAVVKRQEKSELIQEILPLIKAMGEDEFIVNLKAA